MSRRGNFHASMLLCFPTSLRGARILGDAAISVAQSDWETQKRDCHACCRRLAMTETVGNRKREIASAHKTSLAMTSRESIDVESREIATASARPRNDKTVGKLKTEIATHPSGARNDRTVGHLRGPRNDEEGKELGFPMTKG